MSDCLVIIPTYNEKGNIENIVRAVFGQVKGFHLLIVDDGSPDGTADIVRSLQGEFGGRLHLLERAGKLGLGTAYIEGFQWAMKKGYDYVTEMDADFSHNPEDLERLYEAAKPEGVGMSVGSRYMKGGGTENWPLIRRMISQGAAIYVRCILWMPVADPTAGFVCYKTAALKELDLSKLRFNGFAFQIEMKFAIRQLGNKISEVPIMFKDRLIGTSKMNFRIFREAIWGVLMMRFWSLVSTYHKTEE